MEKNFIALVLLAIYIGGAVGSRDSLLESYSEDDEVLLWMKLISRINTIHGETSRLGQSQVVLGETLKEISETQNSQSESLKAVSETQNSLSESLKAITGISEKLSRNLDKLSVKQEIQERKLSEFMEYTEKYFTKFNESSQENLKDIKQGLAEQQNKLSSFIFEYLDKTMEWTTIMRRQDGSVDFYRNWGEYQNGFGDLDGEFFIGLEKLHKLTNNGAPQELYIVLKDAENEKRIARYDNFKIGNETEKYALLELGEYSGDAGDSLSRHEGQRFSTYDQDNDSDEKVNCADLLHGAWWFYKSYYSVFFARSFSHLFGVYKPKQRHGITWYTWRGSKNSLSYAEMKIRPKIVKS